MTSDLAVSAVTFLQDVRMDASGNHGVDLDREKRVIPALSADVRGLCQALARKNKAFGGRGPHLYKKRKGGPPATRLCNRVPLHGQRARHGVGAGLLRGQVLRKCHGKMDVAGLEC